MALFDWAELSAQSWIVLALSIIPWIPAVVRAMSRKGDNKGLLAGTPPLPAPIFACVKISMFVCFAQTGIASVFLDLAWPWKRQDWQVWTTVGLLGVGLVVGVLAFLHIDVRSLQAGLPQAASPASVAPDPSSNAENAVTAPLVAPGNVDVVPPVVAAAAVAPAQAPLPTSLTTTGIYAISRNPIYLGFVIFSTASSLYAPNPVCWALALISTIGHHFVILSEERFLTGMFGEEYLAYCDRTPRYCVPWCNSGKNCHND